MRLCIHAVHCARPCVGTVDERREASDSCANLRALTASEAGRAARADRERCRPVLKRCSADVRGFAMCSHACSVAGFWPLRALWPLRERAVGCSDGRHGEHELRNELIIAAGTVDA